MTPSQRQRQSNRNRASGQTVQENKGVLRTIGSKPTFGDFSLARKVTRRRHKHQTVRVGHRQKVHHPRQKPPAVSRPEERRKTAGPDGPAVLSKVWQNGQHLLNRGAQWADSSTFSGKRRLHKVVENYVENVQNLVSPKVRQVVQTDVPLALLILFFKLFAFLSGFHDGGAQRHPGDIVGFQHCLIPAGRYLLQRLQCVGHGEGQIQSDGFLPIPFVIGEVELQIGQM